MAYGGHLFGTLEGHVVVSRIDRKARTLTCVGAIPVPEGVVANAAVAVSRGRLFVRTMGHVPGEKAQKLLGNLQCYQVSETLTDAPLQSSGQDDPAVAQVTAPLKGLGSRCSPCARRASRR